MKETMLAWLADAGSSAWHVSLVLLALLNASAAAIVVVTRDRGLVDRWTSRWLGANLALITLGVGAPVVTGLIRLALSAMPGFGSVAGTLPK
jgi:hypothetical protein